MFTLDDQIAQRRKAIAAFEGSIAENHESTAQLEWAIEAESVELARLEAERAKQIHERVRAEDTIRAFFNALQATPEDLREMLKCHLCGMLTIGVGKRWNPSAPSKEYLCRCPR